MGKGFNNYMTKKFFHPASKDNIKRVWMAQQKTSYEKKKQEDLMNQYQKEQEMLSNRALLGDEKAKLGLSFLYDAPPGLSKKEKEDEGEQEIKFEWQRKYNAPREAYAKNDETIRDQPFGIEVRNVRCIKCRQWGHVNTDKICPLFGRNLTAEPPQPDNTTASLLEGLKEDGFQMKKSIMGRLMEGEDESKVVGSDNEDDPEVQFLKSLTPKQKKKLMKKLNKLQAGKGSSKMKKSKKEKKKRKKSRKADSDSDSDQKTRKKKSKSRKKKSETSSESSSSEESGEDDRRVEIARNKNVRAKERPQRHYDRSRSPLARSSHEQHTHRRLESSRRDSNRDQHERYRDRKHGGNYPDSDSDVDQSQERKPYKDRRPKARDVQQRAGSSEDRHRDRMARESDRSRSYRQRQTSSSSEDRHRDRMGRESDRSRSYRQRQTSSSSEDRQRDRMGRESDRSRSYRQRQTSSSSDSSDERQRSRRHDSQGRGSKKIHRKQQSSSSDSESDEEEMDSRKRRSTEDRRDKPSDRWDKREAHGWQNAERRSRDYERREEGWRDRRHEGRNEKRHRRERH